MTLLSEQATSAMEIQHSYVYSKLMEAVVNEPRLACYIVYM